MRGRVPDRTDSEKNVGIKKTLDSKRIEPEKNAGIKKTLDSKRIESEKKWISSQRADSKFPKTGTNDNQN